MNDFDTTKRIISENIIRLRTDAHLTQSELANKLGYTDKAISKWERAESLPDITTLKKLADMFGITLDALASAPIQPKPKSIMHSPVEAVKKMLTRNKFIIPILAALLAWVAATVVFVFLYMLGSETAQEYSWLSFIYAIPASLIIFLVFNAIWGKKILALVIESLIAWTIALCIYLPCYFLTSLESPWLFFLIPIPLQVLAVLWYFSRIGKDKKKPPPASAE